MDRTKAESGWKPDPTRPKSNQLINDEMNFIFSLDAFSWKAMQRNGWALCGKAVG